MDRQTDEQKLFSRVFKQSMKRQQSEVENAAREYANKTFISIAEMKSKRGNTLLYYAFLAGVEWHKNQPHEANTFSKNQ